MDIAEILKDINLLILIALDKWHIVYSMRKKDQGLLTKGAVSEIIKGNKCVLQVITAETKGSRIRLRLHDGNVEIGGRLNPDIQHDQLRMNDIVQVEAKFVSPQIPIAVQSIKVLERRELSLLLEKTKL